MKHLKVIEMVMETLQLSEKGFDGPENIFLGSLDDGDVFDFILSQLSIEHLLSEWKGTKNPPTGMRTKRIAVD